MPPKVQDNAALLALGDTEYKVQQGQPRFNVTVINDTKALTIVQSAKGGAAMGNTQSATANHYISMCITTPEAAERFYVGMCARSTQGMILLALGTPFLIRIPMEIVRAYKEAHDPYAPLLSSARKQLPRINRLLVTALLNACPDPDEVEAAGYELDHTYGFGQDRWIGQLVHQALASLYAVYVEHRLVQHGVATNRDYISMAIFDPSEAENMRSADNFLTDMSNASKMKHTGEEATRKSTKRDRETVSKCEACNRTNHVFADCEDKAALRRLKDRISKKL